MVPDMRATGNLICSMDLVKRFGLMGHVTKETMLTEKNLVRVLMSGLTEVHMMEIG